MNIAIITARSGSKRIPKKNIKKFCGKPIIYWAIKAVKKSKIFDKIIVSTDSKKIAKIVKKYNIDVPFIRPKKFSGDYVGTNKVMVHAIKWLIKNNCKPNYVCCIYPTAAFIRPIDILKGYRIIKKNKNSFVFSGSSFVSSVTRSFYRNSKRKLKMLFSKDYYKRSQDLKEIYFDAGQFYWGSKNSWLTFNSLLNNSSDIVYIPKWRAIDIDTKEDWKKAEKFAKLNNLIK